MKKRLKLHYDECQLKLLLLKKNIALISVDYGEKLRIYSSGLHVNVLGVKVMLANPGRGQGDISGKLGNSAMIKEVIHCVSSMERDGGRYSL